MSGVYEDMLAYMDFMGFEYNKDDEEEIPMLSYNPQQIVNMLFLWHTKHSGGTSTLNKCQELGIDTDDYIVFKPENEEDE